MKSVLKLMITTYCDQHCRHCPFANNNARDRVFENVDVLVRQVQQFLKGNQSKSPMVLITGGEPLLHPQFKDLVARIFKFKKVRVVISTNGIGLIKDQSFLKWFVKYPWFQIRISTELNLNDYAQLRRSRYFNRLGQLTQILQLAGQTVLSNILIHSENESLLRQKKELNKTLAGRIPFFIPFVSFNMKSKIKAPKKNFENLLHSYNSAIGSEINQPSPKK